MYLQTTSVINFKTSTRRRIFGILIACNEKPIVACREYAGIIKFPRSVESCLRKLIKNCVWPLFCRPRSFSAKYVFLLALFYNVSAPHRFSLSAGFLFFFWRISTDNLIIKKGWKMNAGLSLEKLNRNLLAARITAIRVDLRTRLPNKCWQFWGKVLLPSFGLLSIKCYDYSTERWKSAHTTIGIPCLPGIGA